MLAAQGCRAPWIVATELLAIHVGFCGLLLTRGVGGTGGSPSILQGRALPKATLAIGGGSTSASNNNNNNKQPDNQGKL